MSLFNYDSDIIPEISPMRDTEGEGLVIIKLTDNIFLRGEGEPGKGEEVDMERVRAAPTDKDAVSMTHGQSAKSGVESRRESSPEAYLSSTPYAACLREWAQSLDFHR
jgi:hypothetical protein